LEKKILATLSRGRADVRREGKRERERERESSLVLFTSA
jgi:hypothetical protein